MTTQEEVEPCGCGSTKDVVFGPDPYQSEIHGDDTPVWLCEDCYYELCMDI